MHNLFQNFVSCRGYSKKNKSGSYEDAKTPWEYHWQHKQRSYDALLAKTEQGYWIGGVPQDDVLVLDMDTPEAKTYAETHLSQWTNVFRTNNGYHVYFRSPQTKITGATHETKIGKVTYRTSKNYVIIHAPGREWISTGDLQDLPVDLFPLIKKPEPKETKKTKKINELKALNGWSRPKLQRTTGLSPAAEHLLRKLWVESAPGTLHDVRFVVGLQAGNYRLQGADMEALEEMARRLSRMPEKAAKDLWDGYRYGSRNQQRVWGVEVEETAQQKLTKYFVKSKSFARKIKNSTLRAIGISPNALGASKQVRINGEVERIHEVDFDLVQREVMEETRKEQVEQYEHTRGNESNELVEALVMPATGTRAAIQAAVDAYESARGRPPGDLTDLLRYRLDFLW